MRRPVTLALLLSASTAGAAPSSPSMIVEGMVVDTRARWTADRSRIVTEATVRTATGDVITSYLGGTVDRLTMRAFHGPEPLVVGMRVAITAHEDVDLGQRRHVVVDSARVLSVPAGFVRTGPTKAGHFLSWESGCVFVSPDAGGTTAIQGDGEFEVIEAAVNEWNSKTSSCSYMRMVLTERTTNEVGRDDFNTIKFRDVSWCRPATEDDPMRCHSPSAAGLTTATFVDDATSDRDGAIVDADIELNGVDFAISRNGESLSPAAFKADLQNTLTHELGHLLGLEHPCLAGGDPPRVDHRGESVPPCALTSDPAITEATMFNFQDPGETKKQDLSDDDIAAICTIYAKADDPGTCERVGDDGGCCSASDRPMPALALGLLTLAAVIRRRRKV